MRKPSVLGAALIAGMAAFFWTLAQGPKRSPETYRPRGSGALASGPLMTMPTTLDALEELAGSSPEGLDQWVWFNLAQRRAWAGRAEDARKAWHEASRLAVQRAPDARGYGSAQYILAMSCRELGLEAASMEAAREFLRWHTKREHEDRIGRVWWQRVGQIYRLVDDEAAARRAFLRAAELAEAEAEHDPAAMFELGVITAELGRADEAVEWLRRAAAAGYADLERAEHDAVLGPARDDERWPEILENIRAHHERTMILRSG